MVPMKALLDTHPVKDCAPSKTLVELRTQTPSPIAKTYEEPRGFSNPERDRHSRPHQ